MARSVIKWFQVLVVVSSLMMVGKGWAEEVVDEASATERPGYGVAIADALVIRPFLLAATVVGTVVWVVTSPVTAITGTIGEAGQTLVLEPGAATFYRCLGCTEAGWRNFPKADVE